MFQKESKVEQLRTSKSLEILIKSLVNLKNLETQKYQFFGDLYMRQVANGSGGELKGQMRARNSIT